ncbi:MAG: PHP domain-containing protein [Vulcanimicrobiaceae bacterium]
MVVDFHSHTRESDGTLAPVELVRAMLDRGVEIFSITDHDSLSAYGLLGTAPIKAKLVVGIEINTTYRENEVHILGYRLPLGVTEFSRLLDMNRRARELRVHQMVGKLNAAGHAVSYEDVRAEAGANATLGRPHVAKALIRKGITRSIESAFGDYLRSGKIAYVPSHHVTPQVAINAIKGSGGIAVLAHPGRLKNQALIEEMAQAGIDGLEVYYPRHGAAVTANYRAIADRLKLVATAGSDFHDIRYNKNGVGMDVSAAAIAPFLELVA